MNLEDTGEILKRKSPVLAWVHSNPQAAWAIASALASALVVAGAAVAIFKVTLSGLAEVQVADRGRLEKAINDLADKVNDLSKNGPGVINERIAELQRRQEEIQRWKERVDAGSEIRVPKSRK